MASGTFGPTSGIGRRQSGGFANSFDFAEATSTPYGAHFRNRSVISQIAGGACPIVQSTVHALLRGAESPRRRSGLAAEHQLDVFETKNISSRSRSEAGNDMIGFRSLEGVYVASEQSSAKWPPFSRRTSLAIRG
jgi:hypothetical protein